MEILRSLDLDSFTDRHPQSLSGGKKQRLAIACALASGQEVLFLTLQPMTANLSAPVARGV